MVLVGLTGSIGMEHFQNPSQKVNFHVRAYLIIQLCKIFFGVAILKLARFGHMVLQFEKMENVSDEKYEETN